MSGKSKMNDLNPLHKSTTIGLREAKEIIIYPLSVGEQLKLTDIITEFLRKYFGTEDGTEKTAAESMGDIALINELVEVIKDNVGKIITLTTDAEDADEILDDMTNDQLMDFVTIVYDMNFESARKKLMSLIQKVKGPSKGK